MFFLYLYLDKFPPTFHPISFILVCLVHTRLAGTWWLMEMWSDGRRQQKMRKLRNQIQASTVLKAVRPPPLTHEVSMRSCKKRMVKERLLASKNGWGKWRKSGGEIQSFLIGFRAWLLIWGCSLRDLRSDLAVRPLPNEDQPPASPLRSLALHNEDTNATASNGKATKWLPCGNVHNQCALIGYAVDWTIDFFTARFETR